MKKIIIVLIFITLVSNNLFATTYYVSNSGNDTNSGLSPADSWLTMDNINWPVTFLAGDSILFKRGDTWNEDLTFRSTGVSGSHVVFGAYGEGSKPIIDVPGKNEAISCGGSFVTIQDFILKNAAVNGLSIVKTGGSYSINVFRVEIINSGSNGLAVVKGGSDIIIDSVRVINTGNNAIYFNGTALNKLNNVTVQNCYVSGVERNDGIVVHEDGEHNTAGSNYIFRNNYSELCAEQGFDITTASNVLLDNNITQNNEEGGVVVGWSADNVTIQRHTSINDAPYTAAAIILGATNIKLIYSQIIGNGHHLLWVKKNKKNVEDNIEIYNNVFATDGGGSMVDITEELDNLVVKNNIFTTLRGSMPRVMRFMSSSRPPSHSTFEFDNNIYYSPDGVVQFYFLANNTNYSLSQYQSVFKQDLNSFSANPEFVNLDRVGPDFHLTSISPAIDKGIDVGLTSDFDNLSVPYNSIPDIGAFEYSVPTSVMENSAFLDVLFYPNPVNNFLFIKSGMKIKDTRVVNIHGQNMNVEIVNSSINTAFLKNGLYFLKLESEKGIFTTKFIVQH